MGRRVSSSTLVTLLRNIFRFCLMSGGLRTGFFMGVFFPYIQRNNDVFFRGDALFLHHHSKL